MSNITRVVHMNKTLELPKDEIEKWNNLIESDDVDYEANGFNELSTVWQKTVKFSDGFEIDLKVCTNNREDRDLWSEAVLFSENGCQYSYTDCCYGIDGDFELSWFDNTTGTMHEYKLTVRGV